MNTLSFGQFLIESRAATPAQIREALEFRESQIPTHSRLAVAAGLMSEFDAGRVNHSQLCAGKGFGPAAVSMGLLTQAQADEIEGRYDEGCFNLAEALVRLGQLDAAQAAQLELRFQEDYAKYEIRTPALPASLTGLRLAEAVVDQLPVLAKRIGRLEVQVVDHTGAGGQGDVAATLAISGDEDITVTLVTDQAFAGQLASGLLGLPIEDLDEALLEDGLAEFLNMLAGHISGVLANEGLSVHLDAPTPGKRGEGTAFDVISLKGHATLLLGGRRGTG